MQPCFSSARAHLLTVDIQPIRTAAIADELVNASSVRVKIVNPRTSDPHTEWRLSTLSEIWAQPDPVAKDIKAPRAFNRSGCVRMEAAQCHRDRQSMKYAECINHLFKPLMQPKFRGFLEFNGVRLIHFPRTDPRLFHRLSRPTCASLHLLRSR